MTCTVSANPSSQVRWSAVAQSENDFYSVLDDTSVRPANTVCCVLRWFERDHDYQY